jgi:hypothetical protein
MENDMVTATSPLRAQGTIAGQTRTRLGRRENFITIICGTWLMIGLFVDGWAHNNEKPESFFTPWHGLFYSGFTATALWVLSRRQRQGAIPIGYGLGFVGLAAFAVGGVGDTHLLLFVSGVLIVSSPLRAAMSALDDRLPLPALVSTTIATATVAFFNMEFSPFITDAMREEPYRFAAQLDQGGEWLADELQFEGLAAILITTVILMAPTLMLLQRWRLPMGSLTLLFGAVSVLESSLWGFEMGETALAGVVAGLAADVLVPRLQGSASTTTVLRAVGFAVPVVLWLAYFGLLAAFYSVGWSVELWLGITVMSGLAGLGLAVLMTLPAPTPIRSSPEAST